jgi:hypothetical protein
MKVEFTGEPLEVVEAIRAFQSALGSSGVSVTSAAEDAVSGSWTDEEFGLLWNDLKTGAQEVLMAIAESEGRISNTDLQESIGVDSGFKVAGRMSSLGFAMKRHKLMEKEPLYTYDYANGVYRMKPNIVAMVLKMVAEDTEQTDA